MSTESTASIIDRMQRCMDAARRDYRCDGIENSKCKFSIDLNLNESEQCSLLIVLREALAATGITMSHERIVENTRTEPFHPDSHIGQLVDLYKRIDAAYHGRKTWNRGR